MAVLVEAISVIVRRGSIDRSFRGGWEAFKSDAPNATLCTDGEVVRVGFMDPQSVEHFVSHLRAHGLTFMSDGKCADIAVIDQQRGLTNACDWLEFARIPFGQSGEKVAACWLFEGPRRGFGIHMRGDTLDLHTPPGWSFEGSLSHKFTFVQGGKEESRLKFLRSENGADVFIDLSTGKEVFRALAVADNKIVSDYAAFVTKSAGRPDCFYDVNVLPHPKEAIIAAIEREIVRSPLEEHVEWLRTGAGFLWNFLEGIGPDPLPLLGVNDAQLERTTPDDPARLRELAKIISNNPNSERAQRFRAIAEREAKQIEERIAAAIRMRSALPPQM